MREIISSESRLAEIREPAVVSEAPLLLHSDEKDMFSQSVTQQNEEPEAHAQETQQP